MNFTQLIRRAAYRFPNREAVVTDQRTSSFAEFWNSIAACGQFYSDAGVVPGDRILVVLPNSHEFLHFHFGALKVGAISVPIRYEYTGWEVNRIVRNCEPRILISTTEWFEQQQDRLRLPADVATASIEDIPIRLPRCSDHVFPAPNTAIASINYSYFGSGYPKGAMLTHGNHIRAATGYSRHQGFKGSDRILVMLPMSHVYALSGCVNAGLATAAALVLTRHQLPGSLLGDIARHHITIFSSVPSIFKCLSTYKRRHRHDTTSLRRLVTGGEFMSEARQLAIERTLGVEMVQGYGLTECLPIVCNPPGAGNRRGTLGVPGRRDIHIRIVNGGREVTAGEPGEIQIKSTTTMAGYYRLDEDTRAIFDGEWLRTGDLGFLDEAGYLHFAGITKPVINLNGNKVDPLEVRSALLEHPGIADALISAQAGVQEDGDSCDTDLRVCATVLSTGTMPLNEREIRTFCSQRLAPFKIPQKIVIEDCVTVSGLIAAKNERPTQPSFRLS